jgi:uncharacterized membrane protein (UPF0136 family)
MKIIYLVYLFLSPFIAMAELLAFSLITELLRQQSDMAVIAGVALGCLFLVANYFLINKLIKTNKPNEKTNSNS